MNNNENDVYEARSYGAQSIGFGEKPGIAVMDFQLGFTDPDHSLGGSALVQRAISNSARLLNVARECGVPVANCYTGYSSARDKPYWKITAVLEGFIDGDHSTQFDPRTYNKEYDVAMRKSGASMFFQTPAAAFFNKEGVDTIILLGCVTSGCVRASIVDSFQWGFRTLVPEDCVGDQHERPHWDNLRDVSRRYCDLTTADAMIDAITNWRRNKNQ